VGGEGAADAQEAAVAVLAVDEILEGIQQEDELELFLKGNLREPGSGCGSVRLDGATCTHISV
jgi:hypothetical protein